MAPSARAADYHWGITPGDWSIPGNWVTPGIPTGTDSVYIHSGHTSFINQAGMVADRLSINNASALEIIGSGVLTVGSAITVGDSTAGTLSVLNGGTLDAPSSHLVLSSGTTQNSHTIGTLNIRGAGSTVSVASMDFGHSAVAWGFNTGTLAISEGGVMNVSGSVSFPYSSNLEFGTADAHITGSGSQWNIGGNLNMSEEGESFFKVTDHASVRVDGNVNILNAGSSRISLQDASFTVGGAIVFGSIDTTFAWLDIKNSTVRATNITPANPSLPEFSEFLKLNILGSGSDILLSNANNATGGLEKFFYADSTPEGVSTIRATNGTIDVSGEHYFFANGIALQKADNTFDLYQVTNGSLVGQFRTESPIKIVSDYTNTGTLTVGFDDTAYTVWNPKEDMYFSGEFQTNGWVRIDEKLCNEAVFAKFTSNKEISSETLAAFMAYLNDGLKSTGYRATLINADLNNIEISIPTELFAEYNMFGWGLDGFNELHGLGAGIYLNNLYYIRTPEPATWVMMLLGGLAILGFRKRRKK